MSPEPPEPVDGHPTVVLVGAPGAGKSTVGRALAARLQLPFADTDATIEERVGTSVAEIFADSGEAAFRAEEERVAAELLGRPGVLALGGGAVLSSQTRIALTDHRVVWLRISAGEAAKRVGLTEARPLLLGNVRGRLLRLLQARTPLYEQVASLTIDTDGHDAAAVTELILARLESAVPRPEPGEGHDG